jgi:hypothetical protein
LAAAIALAPVAVLAGTDKNITDGAAKGQANELTTTAPNSSTGQGCTNTSASAKDNGSLTTYKTHDSASPSVACKKLPGKMQSGTITN